MTGDDHADLDVTSQGLVVERDDPAGQIVHRRDPMKRVVVEAMAPEGVLPQTLVAGRPELVVRDAIEAQDAEGLVAMPPLEVRIRRGVSPNPGSPGRSRRTRPTACLPEGEKPALRLQARILALAPAISGRPARPQLQGRRPARLIQRRRSTPPPANDVRRQLATSFGDVFVLRCKGTDTTSRTRLRCASREMGDGLSEDMGDG